jgi:hypothetical protein
MLHDMAWTKRYLNISALLATATVKMALDNQ